MALYNERRLREYIPEPFLIRHRSNRGTTNSRPSISGVERSNESESENETEPDDGNNSIPEINEHYVVDNTEAAEAQEIASTSASRNIDASILDQTTPNAAFVASTAASIVAAISHRITANDGAGTSTGAPILARINEPTLSAAPSASTSASEVDRIEQEIKSELRNRLLEANMRNPIVDLTNDQEEESATTTAAGANVGNIDHNSVDIIERNVFVPPSIDRDEVSAVSHGSTMNAAPIASTSEFQFESDRIKQEIKIELRNRLLEANMRNPLVDLTNDQDEEMALTTATETGANVGIIDSIERNVFASSSTGPNDASAVSQGPTVNVVPVASTSASARNDSSDGFQFDADRIKQEHKTELRNRLLEANMRNPIVDLTNDPEEVAAFAAVQNNFNFDDSDSDDDMQLLSDLVTSNTFVPVQIKFEFNGNDILSGNIPFVTDVS